MSKLRPLALVLLLAACGGSAPAAELTASPTVAASEPSVTPSVDQASGTFVVVSSRSKVTASVREQLANVAAPNDAVLSTSSMTGTIALDPGGGVLPGSTFTVDLRTLASDSDRRDDFVKSSTLQTSRYPTATFVVSGVSTLPSPLPASGTWQFDLAGKLTIKGVTKDVTWRATATRSGDEITANATLTVRFQDFGMSAPRAAIVLSVQDDIRLAVQLVAAREA